MAGLGWGGMPSPRAQGDRASGRIPLGKVVSRDTTENTPHAREPPLEARIPPSPPAPFRACPIGKPASKPSAPQPSPSKVRPRRRRSSTRRRLSGSLTPRAQLQGHGTAADDEPHVLDEGTSWSRTSPWCGVLARARCSSASISPPAATSRTLRRATTASAGGLLQTHIANTTSSVVRKRHQLAQSGVGDLVTLQGRLVDMESATTRRAPREARTSLRAPTSARRLRADLGRVGGEASGADPLSAGSRARRRHGPRPKTRFPLSGKCFLSRDSRSSRPPSSPRRRWPLRCPADDHAHVLYVS